VRAFAARLERRFDEERHRLSREVHGQLGQVGPTIKMLALTLQGQLPPPLESLLDDIQQLAEDATRSTQQICAALRPPLLDELGLEPALAHQLELLQEQTGLSTRLALQDAGQFTGPTASRLFRLAQESWTQLLLPRAPKALVLRGGPSEGGYEIELLGTGAHLEAGSAAASLEDFHQRAAVVGGRFEFTTTQDGSLRAWAWLPGEVQA